ncbi:GvpL/GvpF family gas vesicle protein [Thermocrispum agreste]|uniref:GvpL/GvpF family gas vesicle protein n=1 Tax=Thermocrispum agreste TaxID=37925 RepID=UPI000411F19B|nr:GvpL/GvpF family gas vesicle protein [Thermocrispum agreste]
MTLVTVYVYGVVRAEDTMPEGPGIGDPATPVRGIVDGDIAAVVSDLPDAYELTEQDAVGHLDVLNALASQQVVLPMQFGTVAPDDAAVRREVLTAPGLRASLDALEPFVEVRLEFTHDEEALLREIIAGDPGLREDAQTTSFDVRVSLGQRIAERVEQLVVERGENLMSALDGIAESVVRLPVDDVHEDKWAVLVRRTRLSEADEAVRGIGQTAPEVRIGYFGPMPTFSFLPAVQAEEPQSRWGW